MSDNFEMWLKIGMSITALIGGSSMAILSLLKRKKCKKKVKNQKEFEKIHTRVHEVLTELRLTHDCARTSIVQFHNGGTYYNGNGMQRFSTTHESAAIGVPSIMNNQQDILLTRYPEILQYVAQDEPDVVIVSEMQESTFKRYLDYNHILAFSLISLKDELTGLIIGYISSEWCRWNKIDDIKENDIKGELEDARRLISIMITQNKDKRDINKK